MATKIQIDYEEMTAITSTLSDESGFIEDAYNNGRTAFDTLKGKWASPAATQFYHQTESMLMRFDKLVDAVNELVVTADTIAQTLCEIEEDAKAEFSWLKELALGSSSPSVTTGNSTGPQITGNESWQKYVNQTSHSEVWRGKGCVAYLLSSMYVPWVSDGKQAPGDARKWLENARAWNEAHPEYEITIDHTPRPGAIAVWPNWGQADLNGDGIKETYGHIARVESVNGNQFVGLGGNSWINGRDAGMGHWFGANGQLDGPPNKDTFTAEQSGYNEVRFIHFPWEEI